MFDYEIDGIGFFAASSGQFPTTRKTADWRAQQIDTSRDPGEQSLNNWWRRAQSSFHLGRGITYMDPAADPQLGFRFAESHGVNPWTQGQVSLLRKSSVVAASANSGLLAVGYSIGGHTGSGSTGTGDGVLFADGNKVYKVDASGAPEIINWGGGSTILDMCTDGGAYYIAATDGIYRGELPGNGVAGWRIYTASPGRAKIAFAKDRLIACLDASIYELPPKPAPFPAALPQALWTNPNAGWIWSAVSDGPNGIYFAGYAGDHSLVYMTTLANSNGTPQLQVPYTIAEVSRGEIVTALYCYSGNIVIVGTTEGFRFASIQNDGSLTMGNVIATDAPVYAASGRANFLWMGGANSDGKAGLYRASLSTILQVMQSGNAAYLVGSQFWSLQFPHAKDLYADGVAFTGQPIRSVVPIGLTGRMAYTIDGVGLVFESADKFVDSGWLQTGRIRYDMTDRKIFAYGRVLSSTQAGHLTVDWVDEALTGHTVADYDTAGTSEANFEIDKRTPHTFISLKITLGSGAAGTSTPVFTEYMIRAMPSAVKQRSIQLSLMCAAIERPAVGHAERRGTWDRIKALEALDESSAIVTYKDNNTGEVANVIVESVTFALTSIPETRVAKANPEGVLAVTLRTVGS